MLADCLLIRIKDAFHELLCVVHAHPIQGNEKPHNIWLVFDAMMREVIQDFMNRLWADTKRTPETAQILLVSSPLYAAGFKANKLKAEAKEIEGRLYHRHCC